MNSLVYNIADENFHESTTRVSHHHSFWTSFPLFTKLLLIKNPSVAKIKDCNGDYPLHCISSHRLKNENINRCYTCGIIPSGAFHSWRKTQFCSKCRKGYHMVMNDVTSLLQYQCTLYFLSTFAMKHKFSLSRLISCRLWQSLCNLGHSILVDLIINNPGAASMPDYRGK